MLNQHVADIPTLPVNLRFFSLLRDPGGMLSRSIGMPNRKDGPPSIWDTHGISGSVFCRSSCVFYSILSAGFEPMELFRFFRNDSLINCREESETSSSLRSEMPVWTVSQKFVLLL